MEAVRAAASIDTPQSGWLGFASIGAGYGAGYRYDLIIVGDAWSQVGVTRSPVETEGYPRYCWGLEEGGGSVWESNPPSRVLAPITGFEVQAAHQHRYASIA